MNPILSEKLQQLEQAENYACWYLVKQPTAFDSLCYLVSFLEEYKANPGNNNLQSFIGQRVALLRAAKPELELSDNYRALRVAAVFGLIRLTSSKYDDAMITDTFREVTARCGGVYEYTVSYRDIVQRQIEKMYISSPIDEEYQGVRGEYRLYPVMLLYKVLLELGRSEGDYAISMTEYRYLVATTRVYDDFLETLLLIKLLRADQDRAVAAFEQYRSKFDNRLIQALKQLDTLTVEKDTIRLKGDRIQEVAKKVFAFEQDPMGDAAGDYLGFLGSARSLFRQEASVAEAGAAEPAGETVAPQQEERLTTGCNVLLYGVPGSGKSWTIQQEYCTPGSQVERLVFHPDYTYADFVGQIMPNVDANGQVSYRFAPGPFTRILRDAYRNPGQAYLLVIEEINRGNAPAIFGEIFQLLDRKQEIREDGDDGFPIGTSEYAITNSDIADWVYGEKTRKVRIPSNLSIIGTMNTSDQNVFTLDTAFQRRWDMRLVENDFDNVDPALAQGEILDTTVTWRSFCQQINHIVVGNSARMTSAEDKRLGAYFVHLGDLRFDEAMGLTDGEYDGLRRKEREKTISSSEKVRPTEIRKAMKQNRKFPEKVIKYLWDDAFKFNREVVFDTAVYHSLEQVIHAFLYASGAQRFKMFKDDVREAFANPEG